jgi:hypothetical protein
MVPTTYFQHEIGDGLLGLPYIYMNRKSTSQWIVTGKWCVLGFIPKKTCKQVLEIIMND